MSTPKPFSPEDIPALLRDPRRHMCNSASRRPMPQLRADRLNEVARKAAVASRAWFKALGAKGSA